MTSRQIQQISKYKERDPSKILNKFFIVIATTTIALLFILLIHFLFPNRLLILFLVLFFILFDPYPPLSPPLFRPPLNQHLIPDLLFPALDFTNENFITNNSTKIVLVHTSFVV